MMLRNLLLCLLLCLGLAACGDGESADAGSEADVTGEAAAITSFPAVVEGEFSVTVAEGDIDEGGASAFNFGEIIVDGKAVHVEVDGAVLSRAGLTGEEEEAVRVRATLGSSKSEYGLLSYTVTAIEKL